MLYQSYNSSVTCRIVATSTLFVAATILILLFIPFSKAMMVKDKEPSSYSSILKQVNSVNLNYYAINHNSTINDIALLTTRSALNNNNDDNNNKEKQISGIIYTMKFECGVISEDAGLLTPGYYDTDVSVFNKQEYPVTVLLNVIVNNGSNSSSNSIIKTLQPQKSTGISCKDIVGVFNIKIEKELVGGFMTILVRLDNGILGSLSNSGAINITPVIQSLSSLDQINLLDVRLFYSANSFVASPPQNHVVVHKIGFSILNATHGKIPQSMTLKTLYVNSQSLANTIFDPEAQVKRILAGKYNLSSSELTNLKVKIYDIHTSATTILDRYAISSLHIQPQAIYQ
jgi:hypothetical protein